MNSDEHILHRTYSSSYRSTNKILPSSHTTTTSDLSSNLQVHKYSTQDQTKTLSLPIKPRPVFALIRSLLNAVSLQTLLQTCRWLTTPSTLLRSSSTLGRTVTGTLFGSKKGHVSFAVQEDPRSDPVFLIELATSTSNLVKEMSSGLVRIALECKVGSAEARRVKLFQEPNWTMYCNGRKCGYAMSRACGEYDWHVLSTVQTVSTGAGVIPAENRTTKTGSWEGGEVMYMRSRFERVVGNQDSEAFYMLNPDGMGGPELSIFLLRI
ncbi:Mizu-kussei [Thalictrum thalictroides]|uniref:Mizu-kussei n=1 Tax=Thalictrum thalictroides TaxID=46969 RepID=A0A7J6USC9_THATH|nr:Mizu-kussei [Thalictrum thalictroides]